MAVRKAVVKNGQLVLEEPLDMPDGTELEVEIELDDNPFLFMAKNAVDMGITDFAEQHDHYIYGTPKRPPETR